MKRLTWVFVCVVLSMILASCNLPKAKPADTAELASTQAAMTVEAMRTQAPTSVMASGTAPALTAEPTLGLATQSPQTTPVSENTTVPTPTPPACDAADFSGDVTIPDGSAIPAGSKFVKTWRLKNTGTCTWTTSYSIVFVDGTSFGAAAATNMPRNVAPGELVEISVELTAPANNGEYRGNFKLRNPAGIIFGTGSNRTAPFYVDITVAAPQSTGSGYSFSDNYCSAQWATSDGSISCTNKDGDSKGFVLRDDTPALETGQVDDEPGLITVPPAGSGKFIQGKFPPLIPQSGDRFRSIIGCEANASSCQVKFSLDYQIGSGAVQNFASWSETYDQKYTFVDVDISSLAGQTVQLILTVRSEGSNGGDRALWLKPRIER